MAVWWICLITNWLVPAASVSPARRLQDTGDRGVGGCLWATCPSWRQRLCSPVLISEDCFLATTSPVPAGAPDRGRVGIPSRLPSLKECLHPPVMAPSGASSSSSVGLEEALAFPHCLLDPGEHGPMTVLSQEREDGAWWWTQIPWDLVKVQMLIQEAWAGLNLASLTRSLGMLVPLVHGPHSEEQGPKCLLGQDKRMSP